MSNLLIYCQVSNWADLTSGSPWTFHTNTETGSCCCCWLATPYWGLVGARGPAGEEARLTGGVVVGVQEGAAAAAVAPHGAYFANSPTPTPSPHPHLGVGQQPAGALCTCPPVRAVPGPYCWLHSCSLCSSAQLVSDWQCPSRAIRCPVSLCHRHRSPGCIFAAQATWDGASAPPPVMLPLVEP